MIRQIRKLTDNFDVTIYTHNAGGGAPLTVTVQIEGCTGALRLLTASRLTLEATGTIGAAALLELIDALPRLYREMLAK